MLHVWKKTPVKENEIEYLQEKPIHCYKEKNIRTEPTTI